MWSIQLLKSKRENQKVLIIIIAAIVKHSLFRLECKFCSISISNIEEQWGCLLINLHWIKIDRINFKANKKKKTKPKNVQEFHIFAHMIVFHSATRIESASRDLSFWRIFWFPLFCSVLICFSVFFIAFYLRILWLLLFFNSFVARDKSFNDFCCSALQQNRCGIKYAQKRPQNERRKIMFLHNLKFKSKNSQSLFALPMSLCLPWTLICTFSHLKWCKVTANPTTRPFT